MRIHTIKLERIRFSVIVLSFCFSAFSFPMLGWSLTNSRVQNPVVRNPVGSPTVPQSSFRSGMVRSPNPYEISSNLVVTGNVAGGKHFRGVVPYNAFSDFSGNIGSSELDSFLRRSAGSENYRDYTGQLTPYFSQTKTVTTLRPTGFPAVVRPPSTRINDTMEGYVSPSRLDSQTLPKKEDTASDIWFSRPMSARPQELQRTLSSEVERYFQSIKSAEQQRRHEEQIEQFRRDLKQVSDKAAELKRDLTSQESPRLSTKLEPGVEVARPLEIQQVPQEQESEGEKLDVYEQMKKQTDDLQKIVDQLAAAKGPNEPAKSEEEQGKEEVPEEGKGPQPKDDSQVDKLAEVSMSAVRAKAILGKHKTFASFSEDKFNQHLRIAENYLKQGKYYWAADAYTLASIYKPNDPLAYAGKSHALFAAGEYMSSALFLARALEIFPEYARFKIDLVAMVGDKDKLESRISDVEQWLEINHAAELRFLLGYIYYQMGREQRAKEAIEAAYKEMPESPAVIALRDAINQAY